MKATLSDDRPFISHFPLVPVDVLQCVRVAKQALDIHALQVGRPALVNPHIADIRGGACVAKPSVKEGQDLFATDLILDNGNPRSVAAASTIMRHIFDFSRLEARRLIEAAGLDPYAIPVGNPEAVVIQVRAGDEVFAVPLIRLEAVGKAVEGRNRHSSLLMWANDSRTGMR